MSIIPGTVTGTEHLNQLVERIESLEEEKWALMADIKYVYAEFVQTYT